MKLHRIETHNLNSLYGDNHVDLDGDLRGASLFLIQGPTGAGKSTLMDAISLALFGTTPRLDQAGSEKAVAEQVMSRGAGTCRACVEFSKIDGPSRQRVRYRAAWKGRRAYKKPGGTMQDTSRSLERQQADGTWTTLTSDHRNKVVQPHFDEVLEGFTPHDFQRSMLLAQGRFDAMLHAPPDERAMILERLTDTKDYERIGARAARMRGAWEGRIADLRAARDAIQPLSTEQIDQARASEAAHQASLKANQARIEATNASVRWLDGRDERAKALDAAEQTQKAVAEDRERAADAQRALAEHERCVGAFEKEDAYGRAAERAAANVKQLDALAEELPSLEGARDRAGEAATAAQALVDSAEQAGRELRDPAEAAATALEAAHKAAQEHGEAKEAHGRAAKATKAKREARDTAIDALKTKGDALEEAARTVKAHEVDAPLAEALPDLKERATRVSQARGDLRRDEQAHSKRGEAITREAEGLEEDREAFKRARTTAIQPLRATAWTARRALIAALDAGDGAVGADQGAARAGDAPGGDARGAARADADGNDRGEARATATADGVGVDRVATGVAHADASTDRSPTDVTDDPLAAEDLSPRVDATLEALDARRQATETRRQRLEDMGRAIQAREDAIDAAIAAGTSVHSGLTALLALTAPTSTLRARIDAARESLRTCQRVLAPLERIAALGEERDALVEGEPCPLCGSDDHPFVRDPEHRRRTAQIEAEVSQAREARDQAVAANDQALAALSSHEQDRATKRGQVDQALVQAVPAVEMAITKSISARDALHAFSGGDGATDDRGVSDDRGAAHDERPSGDAATASPDPALTELRATLIALRDPPPPRVQPAEPPTREDGQPTLFGLRPSRAAAPTAARDASATEAPTAARDATPADDRTADATSTAPATHHVERLDALLQTLRARRATPAPAAEPLAERLDDIAAHVRRIRAAHTALHRAHTALRTERDALAARAGELERRHARLEQARRDHQERHDELARRRADLQDRSEALANDLRTFGIDVDPPEDGMDTANRRVRALEDALRTHDKLHREHERANDALDAAEEALKTAMEAEKSASKALDNRQTTLGSARKEASTTTQTLAEAWTRAERVSADAPAELAQEIARTVQQRLASKPAPDGLPGTPRALLLAHDDRLSLLRSHLQTRQDEHKTASTAYSRAHERRETLVEAQAKLKAEQKAARDALDQALLELDLKDDDALRARRLPAATLEQARAQRTTLDRRQTEARTRLEDAAKAVKAHAEARPEHLDEDTERDALDATLTELNQARDTLTDQLAEAQATLKQAAEQTRALERAQRALDRAKDEAAVWLHLHQLIGVNEGKSFRNFAQALNLDQLLRRANLHLARFAERYRLRTVRDPETGLPTLEFEIEDRWLADVRRSLKSLSGGESFLVSLALALGLSDLRTSSMPVETLLLDEGFGTLDRQTLDVALAALDQLQTSGRQVGIISHVVGLRERIEARVLVEPVGEGRSRVRVAG